MLIQVFENNCVCNPNEQIICLYHKGLEILKEIKKEKKVLELAEPRSDNEI